MRSSKKYMHKVNTPFFMGCSPNHSESKMDIKTHVGNMKFPLATALHHIVCLQRSQFVMQQASDSVWNLASSGWELNFHENLPPPSAVAIFYCLPILSVALATKKVQAWKCNQNMENVILYLLVLAWLDMCSALRVKILAKLLELQPSC